MSHNRAAQRLRVAQEAGETYAVATAMLGGCMFYCVGMDRKKRLCRIRGKFAGRNKRDNLVEVGKWVLVGARDWEQSSGPASADDVPQCDLLEVYADQDKVRLQDAEPTLAWAVLDDHDPTRKQTIEVVHSAVYDTIVFDTEQDRERDRWAAELQKESTVAMSLALPGLGAAASAPASAGADDDDDICVDDI